MRIRHCSCLHILSISFIPLLSCLFHSMITISNRPLSSSQRSSTNFPHSPPTFLQLISTPIVHSFPFYRFLTPKISFGPHHSSLQYFTLPHCIAFSKYIPAYFVLFFPVSHFSLCISPPPPGGWGSAIFYPTILSTCRWLGGPPLILYRVLPPRIKYI